MISALNMIDCFFQLKNLMFSSYTINEEVNLFIIKYENHFTFFFIYNNINVNIDKIKDEDLYSYRVSYDKKTGIMNDISVLQRIDEYIILLNNKLLNEKLEKKLEIKETKEKRLKI